MIEEIKNSLESLAFLAELAVSVEDRRRLDSLLRETETTVETGEMELLVA